MNAQFITTSLKSAVNAAYSKHGYNLRGLPFNQDWYAHLFANSWNLTSQILKQYPLAYIEEMAGQDKLTTVTSMLDAFKHQMFLKILSTIETTGERLNGDDIEQVFTMITERLNSLEDHSLEHFHHQLNRS